VRRTDPQAVATIAPPTL